MQKLKELIIKVPILEALPLFLLPIAYFNLCDFFFTIINLVIPVILTIYVWEHRKEQGNKFCRYAIGTDILIIVYLLCGYTSANLVNTFLTIMLAYSIYHKWDWYGIILAGTAAPFMMAVSVVAETCWIPSYVLRVAVYSTSIIWFLSFFVGLRTAANAYMIFQMLFRAANIYYSQYRYSHIGIMDIFCIPTFLNVAGQYHFSWDPMLTYLTVVLVIEILFIILIPKYKPERKWKLVITSFLLSIFSFFGIGIVAYEKWQTEERDMYYVDYFAMSTVEEIRMILDAPNIEEEKEKIEEFSDDVASLKPNIITIMCESYSDVVNIRGLSTSENPVDPLWEIGKTDPHAKTGTVHINTVGGGTSVSEWEYQTGLNHVLLSESRIPFFSDCKQNYTFSAAPMYDDYYKLFIHPYLSSGWNRTAVYQNFDYDEMIFDDNGTTIWNQPEQRIRTLVSDAALIDTIKEEMDKHEEPLFSMNVTMQNHGGYAKDFDDPEEPLERTVKVYGDEEDKEYLETYLELQKRSTEAILDFVEYLKEHPEEPTILIFFGDHFPSEIKMPEGSEGYETPYLVYSNFSDLEDMPEWMDLSLLYPNAKKAAGMALTSWEKYLLSLDGNTADRAMILARIKKGYF